MDSVWTVNQIKFINEILIENQPTLINPTMKTIASLLYGYFVMRGIVEKQKTNSQIVKYLDYLAEKVQVVVNENKSLKSLNILSLKLN